MKNYYKVLGIPQDASLDDIERAYQVLAKQYNPEKNRGDKYSTERFIDISVAYKTLKDADKRNDYDRVLLSILKKGPVESTNPPSGRKTIKEKSKSRRSPIIYYVVVIAILATGFVLFYPKLQTDELNELPVVKDGDFLPKPVVVTTNGTRADTVVSAGKKVADIIEKDKPANVSEKEHISLSGKVVPADTRKKERRTTDTLVRHEIKLKPETLKTGSAKNEVLSIQGTPTSIASYGDDKQMWYYGRSTIFFVNGKATVIKNTDNNLKID